MVTGALKLFLRELPEPLVPYGLFNPFIEAVSKCLPTGSPGCGSWGAVVSDPCGSPRAAGPPGAGAAGG